MKIYYYSELLKKSFDKEEDLVQAEKEFLQQGKEKEKAKAALDKKLEECQALWKEYCELRSDYMTKYESKESERELKNFIKFFF